MHKKLKSKYIDISIKSSYFTSYTTMKLFRKIKCINTNINKIKSKSKLFVFRSNTSSTSNNIKTKEFPIIGYFAIGFTGGSLLLYNIFKEKEEPYYNISSPSKLLVRAVAINDHRLVDLLLKNKKVNPEYIYGRVSFIHRLITMFEIFIKNGTKIDILNKEIDPFGGNIFFEIARSHTNIEEYAKLIKYLAKNGIDINHEDYRGTTSLAFAIGRSDEIKDERLQMHLIEAFVESGANIGYIELGTASNIRKDTLVSDTYKLNYLLENMEQSKKIEMMNVIMIGMMDQIRTEYINIDTFKIFCKHCANINENLMKIIENKENIPEIKRILKENDINI